jgi:DNA invertase Pin-like site-specific DNA recombinase
MGGKHTQEPTMNQPNPLLEKRYVPTELGNKAIALRLEGKGAKAIARELNVARHHVARCLKEAKVK